MAVKNDTIEETGAVRYGFHGRLKSEFPSQIVVDITEVCNLACPHCPHPEFKLSEYYGAAFLSPGPWLVPGPTPSFRLVTRPLKTETARPGRVRAAKTL